MSNESVINLSSKATEWFEHIKAWENGDESQRQFCESRGLSLSAFGYWRTTYLQQQTPHVQKIKTTSASKVTPAFIAIKTTPPSSITTEVIQVRHSCGLSLALPLAMSINDIVTLLQGIGGCHAN